MFKRTISTTLCLLAMTLVFGQSISYEYWLDADYQKRGFGTGSTESISYNVDFSALPPGVHFLNFRAKPASGTWGSVMRQIFLVPDASGDISQYEYWLDSDYNHRVSKTNNGGDVQTTIDISSLSTGIHFINFRAKQSTGTWGSVMRQIFVVPEESGTISRCESWIDGDYDHRKTIASNGTPIVDPVDISSLSSGLHFYNLRIQDSNGMWGPVERYMFWVPERNVQLELAAIEYWIDEQSATVEQVTGTSIQLSINISTLETGEHQFNCRVQASNGNWSSVHSSSFVIEAPNPQNVDDPAPQEAFLEYFIDIDPGYGKATKVKDISAGSNELEFELGDAKPGAHMLYVRTKDEQGRWSTTVSRPLYIRKPVEIVALEYFFDGNDPGQGKAFTVTLPKDDKSEFSFDVELKGLAAGAHQICVRSKNSDGLWSVISKEQFTLTEDAGIGVVGVERSPSVTYTLKGYRSSGQKGINIVRYNDGTTQKVIIKY